MTGRQSAQHLEKGPAAGEPGSRPTEAHNPNRQTTGTLLVSSQLFSVSTG